MVTVGDLASSLGISPGDADPAIELTGLAPLERAGAGHLAFIADKKYLEALRGTSAACVLLRQEWLADSPVPALATDDPYLAYAKASQLFDRRPEVARGIHALASVDPTAIIGDGVRVAAGACIEAGAELGDGVSIGSGAFVGAGTRLGAGSKLEPNVVLYHGVSLGSDCTVHAGSVLGSDGFGYAREKHGWRKISQLGGVRVGDRVEIGAGCTIDRGALDDTVIHDDVIIDNQVHIAHNCVIGARTAIAGCVGVAGSTIIGADCTFGGQVGLSGHIEICDNAHFTGQARVNGSITEPGTYSSGTPLQPVRQWRRNAVRFGQLDALQQRIVALEAALKEAALKEATQPDDNKN